MPVPATRTVIQPFAEANWLHTSDDVSVSFDDATVKQDLPLLRAELKVGLQADIDKQWSVRAPGCQRTGSNDFGDLNGSLNLRYNWCQKLDNKTGRISLPVLGNDKPVDRQIMATRLSDVARRLAEANKATSRRNGVLDYVPGVTDLTSTFKPAVTPVSWS